MDAKIHLVSSYSIALLSGKDVQDFGSYALSDRSISKSSRTKLLDPFSFYSVIL